MPKYWEYTLMTTFLVIARYYLPSGPRRNVFVHVEIMNEICLDTGYLGKNLLMLTCSKHDWNPLLAGILDQSNLAVCFILLMSGDAPIWETFFKQKICLDTGNLGKNLLMLTYSKHECNPLLAGILDQFLMPPLLCVSFCSWVARHRFEKLFPSRIIFFLSKLDVSIQTIYGCVYKFYKIREKWRHPEIIEICRLQ